MRIYLKLFLGMGIPFAIFMSFFYSLRFGFRSGIIRGIFSGIAFGLFMSITLGWLHHRSIKKMPFANSENQVGVHQMRTLRVKLPYETAFGLCKNSLRMIKKGTIQNENSSAGRIEAKAGMTWKTWGERISFDVRKISDRESEVEVSSRPIIRTTLVDYGKNLENVERILLYLKGQDPASSQHTERT